MGPLGPWKLSDGAGKIPSAHSAAEAEEEAVEAAEAVESELVDEAKRCEDAMSHRVRTSPGVAMTFRCRSAFKFKCIFGSGFGNPTRSMNSTRMAHAASTVDCAVAGSSKIAVSASKPAASVCAAGAVAPRERADASKERTSPAVARFIFFWRLGDFTCWLGCCDISMLMAPAFLKKKCFSWGARRPPYTGGSKKIIFGVGLKKKKRKKENKRKEPEKGTMLAAAAIARRGETKSRNVRGASRPSSEGTSPSSTGKTRPPPRGSSGYEGGDHGGGHHGGGDYHGGGGSGRSAGTGTYSGGRDTSAIGMRGGRDGSGIAKTETRRGSYYPVAGSGDRDTGYPSSTYSAGSSDRDTRALVIGGGSEGGGTKTPDQSRLLASTEARVIERRGSRETGGIVSSGKSTSGLPSDDPTIVPTLYVVGDTTTKFYREVTVQNLAFAKTFLKPSAESADFGVADCTADEVFKYIRQNEKFKNVVLVDYMMTPQVLVSSDFRDLVRKRSLEVASVSDNKLYDREESMRTYTAYYKPLMLVKTEQRRIVAHLLRTEQSDSSPAVYGLGFMLNKEDEYLAAKLKHNMASVVSSDDTYDESAFDIKTHFIERNERRGVKEGIEATITGLKEELLGALRKNAHHRKAILMIDATGASSEQLNPFGMALKSLIESLIETLWTMAPSGTAFLLGFTTPSDENTALLSSLEGLVNGKPVAGKLMKLSAVGAGSRGPEPAKDPVMSPPSTPRPEPAPADSYVVVRSGSKRCEDVVAAYELAIGQRPKSTYKVKDWNPTKTRYANPTRIVIYVDDSDIVAVCEKLESLDKDTMSNLKITIQYLSTTKDGNKLKYVLPRDRFDDATDQNVINDHAQLGSVYISTPALRTGEGFYLNLVVEKNTDIDDHIRAAEALEIFKRGLDAGYSETGKRRLNVHKYVIHDTKTMDKPRKTGALAIVITRKRLIENGGGVAAAYSDEERLVRKWAGHVEGGGVMFVDSGSHGEGIKIAGVDVQLNTIIPLAPFTGAKTRQMRIADQSTLLAAAAVVSLLNPVDRLGFEKEITTGTSVALEIGAIAKNFDEKEGRELARALADLKDVSGVGKPVSMAASECIGIFNSELERLLDHLYKGATKDANKRAAAFIRDRETLYAKHGNKAAASYCAGADITEAGVRGAALKYHNERLDRVIIVARNVNEVLAYREYKRTLDSLVNDQIGGLRFYLRIELLKDRAERPEGDRAYALSGNPKEKASEKFEQLKRAASQKVEEAATRVTKSASDAALDTVPGKKQRESSDKNEITPDKEIFFGEWIEDVRKGITGLIEAQVLEGNIDKELEGIMRLLVTEVGANAKSVSYADKKIKAPRGARVAKRFFDELKREAERTITSEREKTEETERLERLRIELREKNEKRQSETASRIENIRLEKELAKKQTERMEAERMEAERKQEAERMEAERKQEAERMEAERMEAERMEAARKQEAAREEAERKQREEAERKEVADKESGGPGFFAKMVNPFGGWGWFSSGTDESKDTVNEESTVVAARPAELPKQPEPVVYVVCDRGDSTNYQASLQNFGIRKSEYTVKKVEGYEQVQNLEDESAIVIIVSDARIAELVRNTSHIPTCDRVYIAADQQGNVKSRLEKHGYEKSGNSVKMSGKQYSRYDLKYTTVGWYTGSACDKTDRMDITEALLRSVGENNGKTKAQIKLVDLMKIEAKSNKKASPANNDLRALRYLIVSCTNIIDDQSTTKNLDTNGPRKIILFGNKDVMGRLMELNRLSQYNLVPLEKRLELDARIMENAPGTNIKKDGGVYAVVGTRPQESASFGQGFGNLKQRHIMRRFV